MAVDDYLEPEVAVAAAATAALFSPRVRGVLRRGLVYGTAGVMTAGDAVVSVAKGAGKGVQRAAGRGGRTDLVPAADVVVGPPTPAKPATAAPRRPPAKPRAPRTPRTGPGPGGAPETASG
jgi:hypothetical protein